MKIHTQKYNIYFFNQNNMKTLDANVNILLITRKCEYVRLTFYCLRHW